MCVDAKEARGKVQLHFLSAELLFFPFVSSYVCCVGLAVSGAGPISSGQIKAYHPGHIE